VIVELMSAADPIASAPSACASSAEARIDSTWSFCSAISGETTTVGPGISVAAIW
jgi:hypothetical protein